mgnify:FL=1
MTILGSLIGLVTVLFVYLWKESYILFTVRLPIYFIGCYSGYLLATGKDYENPKALIVLVSATLVVQCCLTYSIDRDWMFRSSLSILPFALIVSVFCRGISWLLDYVPLKAL